MTCSFGGKGLSASVSVPRDAADLVVQGKGKLEELTVCSREIAASTAQLVAASKVRLASFLVLQVSLCAGGGPMWD